MIYLRNNHGAHLQMSIETFISLIQSRKWSKPFSIDKVPIQVLQKSPKVAEPGKREIHWKT